MGQEIERKYLVNKDKWQRIHKGPGQLYRQGYILTDPQKTIRVRIADSQGWLTIKGLSVSATRPEYEYPIPPQDAEELLDKFAAAVITKVRFRIPFKNKTWEVDEFLSDNAGLVIAEIELASEDEHFDLPDWVDQEVTSEEKYYNSNLSVNPYKNWRYL